MQSEKLWFLYVEPPEVASRKSGPKKRVQTYICLYPLQLYYLLLILPSEPEEPSPG